MRKQELSEMILNNVQLMRYLLAYVGNERVDKYDFENDSMGIYKSNLLLKAIMDENMSYIDESKCESLHEVVRTALEKYTKCIEDLGLNEVVNQRAKTLSGGYQRRLSIALGLISKPKILLLDEPTLGLDVIARRELWKIVNKFKGKITIILTSHYLEEIEALCDRVAILSKGNLLIEGTINEIKEKTNEASFEEAFVKIVGGVE